MSRLRRWWPGVRADCVGFRLHSRASRGRARCRCLAVGRCRGVSLGDCRTLADSCGTRLRLSVGSRPRCTVLPLLCWWPSSPRLPFRSGLVVRSVGSGVRLKHLARVPASLPLDWACRPRGRRLRDDVLGLVAVRLRRGLGRPRGSCRRSAGRLRPLGAASGTFAPDPARCGGGSHLRRGCGVGRGCPCQHHTCHFAHVVYWRRPAPFNPAPPRRWPCHWWWFACRTRVGFSRVRVMHGRQSWLSLHSHRHGRRLPRPCHFSHCCPCSCRFAARGCSLALSFGMPSSGVCRHCRWQWLVLLHSFLAPHVWLLDLAVGRCLWLGAFPAVVGPGHPRGGWRFDPLVPLLLSWTSFVFALCCAVPVSACSSVHVGGCTGKCSRLGAGVVLGCFVASASPCRPGLDFLS